MSQIMDMMGEVGGGLLEAGKNAVQDFAEDPTQNPLDVVGENLAEQGQEMLPDAVKDAAGKIPGLEDLIDPEAEAQNRQNDKMQEQMMTEEGQSDQVSRDGSGDVDGLASDEAGDMAKLGGLVFTLIQEDSAEYPAEDSRHPVPDKQAISDHVWIDNDTFTLRGIFSAGNINDDKHEQSYEKLKEMRDTGDPYTLVWGHPPGKVENVVIRRFAPRRQVPRRHSFEYEVELAPQRIIGQSRAQQGADTSSGTEIEGGGSDKGEVPPESPGDESGTGKKDEQEDDGGGGPFGFIKNAVDTVSDFAQSDIGQMARGALADVARNSPIGGDLMANALEGDFSAGALAESALSMAPGGSILGDVAKTGVNVAESGDFSVQNIASEAVDTFADRIPGGDILSSFI